VRGKPAVADQLPVDQAEQRGDLDHLTLDPSWHRRHLSDAASPVGVYRAEHDQVHARGYGRDDERRGHVRTGQQGEGAQLGDGLAGGAGMNAAQAWDSGK
jgi:hypothetical protein